MKRTAIILLIAIYLLSCVGIGVNRFYCCGKLASIILTYAPVNNDDGAQTAKKNNCCRNEKQSLKIKDNHINTNSFAVDHPLSFAIIHPFVISEDRIIVTQLLTGVYNENAPPGHSHVPAYTLNCTYRI